MAVVHGKNMNGELLLFYLKIQYYFI